MFYVHISVPIKTKTVHAVTVVAKAVRMSTTVQTGLL